MKRFCSLILLVAAASLLSVCKTNLGQTYQVPVIDPQITISLMDKSATNFHLKASIDYRLQSNGPMDTGCIIYKADTGDRVYTLSFGLPGAFDDPAQTSASRSGYGFSHDIYVEGIWYYGSTATVTLHIDFYWIQDALSPTDAITALDQNAEGRVFFLTRATLGMTVTYP